MLYQSPNRALEARRDPPDGQAKVCCSHRAVWPLVQKEKVVWLHISENDALCMALCDEAQHAADDGRDLLFCKGPLLNSVQDATPLTQFHHQVNVFRVFEYILYTSKAKCELPCAEDTVVLL